MILSSISSKKNIKSLFSIILVSFNFYLIIIYSSYYFGKKEIARPITLEVLYPYLKNLNFILYSDFISKTTIYLISFFLCLIGVILYLIHRNIINKFFQSFLYSNYKKALIIFSISFLSLPLILNNFTFFKVRFNNYKKYEPLLTFYYGGNKLVEKRFNPQIVHEINDYKPKNKKNKKNVILITSDALRSDFIGSYGNCDNLTPFLDSLAASKDFSKVDNFYSITSNSFSGITSILSSDYEIYRNNFFLHDVLKKEGYMIKFIHSGDMTSFYGLKNHLKTKSVDIYYDGYQGNYFDSKVNMNNDYQNIIQNLKKIESNKNHPTFIYMHFMTTHDLGYLEKKHKKFLPDKISYFKRGANIRELRNNYKNRMIQLDHYLKESFKLLKEKGFLKNSIVLITSDHGQSLGEMNIFSHAKTTYKSEIKIPLILSNLGHELNSNILYNQLDISPTVIDLLDLKKPIHWKGTSIFKKRINHEIFQNQNDYYSFLWKNNNKTYQYIYKRNSVIEGVYDLNSNFPYNNNLINFIPNDSIQLFRKKIKDFYSIK